VKRTILVLNLALAVAAVPAYADGGVPLWTNRYNGPSTSPDLANSIVTDSSGNVIVSGDSLRASGALQDYATIKYSNAGVPLWTNRYTGLTNSGGVQFGLAVDGNGKVFVTGYSPLMSGPPQYATVAYSAAGAPLWTNYFSGPAGITANPHAIATDRSGNVFVTGQALGGPSGFDFATIKYSNAGLPLWTNSYNGPGNGTDSALAMVVDGSSNVVVTGYSGGSGSGEDYTTIKYSNAGVPLWTNRYNGPANGNDRGNAVAVDTNGNVFVTGYSVVSGDNIEAATLAYSSAGVPLWTNRFHGAISGSPDGANALAVDSNGNVIVAAYSTGSGSGVDYTTIKYSNAGVPLWTNRYNGPANGNDSPFGVAVDSSGNVIVTGRVALNGSTNGFATVAYSSAGLPLWTNLFGQGPPGARGIVLDTSGNIFVTGGATTVPGYVTIKYSSSVSSALSPVPLDFQLMNNQLVLSWTNPGFRLQTSSVLPGPFTTITNSTSPYTNPVTGAQQFFRLVAN